MRANSHQLLQYFSPGEYRNLKLVEAIEVSQDIEMDLFLYRHSDGLVLLIDAPTFF